MTDSLVKKPVGNGGGQWGVWDSIELLFKD